MVFPILGANTESAAYEIENSLRFDDITAHFQRTPGSAGNRQIFTISMWLKICSAGEDTAGHHIFYVNNPSDTTTWGGLYLNGDQLYFYAEASGSGHYNLATNKKFRDPSAWYHIVIAVDTTQNTSSDRIKLYVNGVRETSFGTETYPSQNDNTVFNNSGPHALGAYNPGTNYPPGAGLNMFDGYLADVYMIDGTQCAATSFGEFDEDSGIWKPKKAGVSFGTNGFFLQFKQTGTSADASGKGADTSGNGNHWDDNGMDAIDQCTDTPTNNFCTLNPLMSQTKTPNYLEGNTHFKYATGSSGYTGSPAEWAQGLGTVGLTAGKWYWEVEMQAMGGNGQPGVTGSGTAMGLGNPDASDNYVGKYARGYGFTENGGSLYNNNSASSFGSAVSVGDVLMFALDMDNHKLYYGEGGTWQNSGDPTSGATGTGAASISNDQDFYYPAVSTYNGEYFVNFGNPPFTLSSPQSDANGYGNFEYAVPSGYYAICTKNLAEFGG